MHAGQLGRHGDDENGVSFVGHVTTPIRRVDYRVRIGPGTPRGASWRPSAASSGTTTSTVARRSPGLPLGRGTPRSRTRNVFPLVVPAGTFNADRTVQGRHLDLAAESGLGERDGHGDREVVASPPEEGVRNDVSLDE